MEEIKYEATFKASNSDVWLVVSEKEYVRICRENTGIELSTNGAGRLKCIGENHYRYFFCDGKDHNQITLTDPEDIIRVRERIANDPSYTEISCNDEARMLGGGSNEPVGGRDHSKHIEELKRKYGGDKEHEYSDFDRKLIAKMKQ